MKDKRIFLILSAIVLTVSSAFAQKIALKSNLLYDVTTTLNIGAEVGLSPDITLDISGNLNAWTFGGGKQWRHWLIQPEARYWLSKKFDGHFIGLHAHGGQFNVGNLKFLHTEEVRHQGYLLGAGFTYGYNWKLSDRWKLEAAIGLGYAYLDYDRYPCGTCGKKLSGDTKHYFGPTKAAFSLIYILK